ncbi:MAG: carbohydrate ABC transporter permease [Chloroflexi bacterium]|nr:MAG: carbohydrate ABC transporter permease [Chloroflexota bacterium]
MGSSRRLRPIQLVLMQLLIAIIIIWCLAPFYWTVITSLKQANAIFYNPTTYLPDPVDMTSWTIVVNLPRFQGALINSTIIASSVTVVSLSLGSLCAYAIARLRFPGKNIVLALVLAVSMFPGIAIISPLFLQFRDWDLINNKLALILPGVTFTLPVCIWTLTAFFRDLPRELEEAAYVDGASRIQTFTQVIGPLAAPGVFTTAILLFIASWNEFLFARTFMSKVEQLTAPVAVAQFEGSDIAAATPWGEISAAAIATTIPLVILVLVFQRRIVAGLTAGAVKG